MIFLKLTCENSVWSRVTINASPFPPRHHQTSPAIVYLFTPAAGSVVHEHRSWTKWQNIQNNWGSASSRGEPDSVHVHLLRASKCEFKAAINLPDSSGLWRRPDSVGLSDTWTLSKVLMEGWMGGREGTLPTWGGQCERVSKLWRDPQTEKQSNYGRSGRQWSKAVWQNGTVALLCVIFTTNMSGVGW